MRHLWNFYFDNINAVIYVVDCNDHDRVENECKEELDHLLNAEELKDATFLIYANKQDFPGALDPRQLTEKLGLHNVRNRKWYVQSSIATRGDGLYEGLDWLSQNMNLK